MGVRGGYFFFVPKIRSMSTSITTSITRYSIEPPPCRGCGQYPVIPTAVLCKKYCALSLLHLFVIPRITAKVRRDRTHLFRKSLLQNNRILPDRLPWKHSSTFLTVKYSRVRQNVPYGAAVINHSLFQFLQISAGLFLFCKLEKIDLCPDSFYNKANELTATYGLSRQGRTNTMDMKKLAGDKAAEYVKAVSYTHLDVYKRQL